MRCVVVSAHRSQSANKDQTSTVFQFSGPTLRIYCTGGVAQTVYPDLGENVCRHQAVFSGLHCTESFRLSPAGLKQVTAFSRPLRSAKLPLSILSSQRCQQVRDRLVPELGEWPLRIVSRGWLARARAVPPWPPRTVMSFIAWRHLNVSDGKHCGPRSVGDAAEASSILVCLPRVNGTVAAVATRLRCVAPLRHGRTTGPLPRSPRPPSARAHMDASSFAAIALCLSSRPGDG